MRTVKLSCAARTCARLTATETRTGDANEGQQSGKGLGIMSLHGRRTLAAVRTAALAVVRVCVIEGDAGRGRRRRMG